MAGSRDSAVRQPKRLGAPTGARAENAAETKARLLAIAIDHFSRLGFAGARTEAIARDANVGNRMLLAVDAVKQSSCKLLVFHPVQ